MLKLLDHPVTGLVAAVVLGLVMGFVALVATGTPIFAIAFGNVMSAVYVYGWSK